MPGNSGLLRGLYVDVGAEYGSAVAGLEAVDRAGDDASRSLKNVENRADRASKRTAVLKKTFAGTAVAAGALTAGIAGIVSKYGKVDETYALIEERSGASKRQMAAMRDRAQELGVALPTTAADSANALNELTKAGFTSVQAMDALEGVSYLAVAGQQSVAQAAGVTTSVLSAWQLEAARAASVADTLASASADTRADVDSLGQSLSYAAASAAQVGATSEEITAWSGILASAGQEGTRAGTGIRQALDSIIDPTQKTEDALASVGLSVQDFYDDAGELRDIESIVSMLNESMDDLSAQERSQLLSQIFGIRGQSAISPLIDQSEKLSEVMRNEFAASVAGGIQRINELNDADLKSLNASSAFNIEQGSTKDVLKQLREQSEGLSQSEVETQIASTLEISDEAAARLTVDITGDTKLSTLASTLKDASTAGDQATAVMKTVTGRIEQISGSADQAGANLYRGVAGPLLLILNVAVPVAAAIGENEVLMKALGAAAVPLTIALAGVATAAGLALARSYALAGAQLAAEGATLANAAAQNALSASYWRTQAATVANRASSIGLATARYAGRAAALASAAGEWALTAARNSPATLTAYAREGLLTSARIAGRVVAYSTAAGEWALDTARAAGGALLAAGYEATLTGARYAGRAAAYAGEVSELALLGVRKGARATGMAVAGAEYALAAARESSVATAIAARTSSLGLSAARSAGKVYALGSAGAEWVLTTARESSTAAAIGARVATVAGTAALVAQEGVTYSAAAGQYALAVASGVLSGGLYAAAAGAWALLVPFWPILAIGAGVAALALAIHTNFLGMGDAARFVASIFTGALSTGFSVAAGAVHAFLSPIDTAQGVLKWLTSFDVSSIPLVGGLFATELKVAGIAIHAILNPLDAFQAVLHALTNFDISDIPFVGGALDLAGNLLSGQHQKGQKAGKQFADGVAKGAKANKGKAGKAAGQVAGEMDKRMPHSPAQKGPLANLGGVGSGFVNTITAGLHKNKGQAGGAANSIAHLMMQAFSGMNPQIPTPTVGRPQVPRPEGKPPTQESLTPNQQPRTVVQGVARQVQPREFTPRQEPQTTVSVHAQRTTPDDHEPRGRPRTVVGAVAERTSPTDHQPRQQPRTTVEARSGQTKLGDFTPDGQSQTTVGVQAQRTEATAHVPRNQPRTTVDALATQTKAADHMPVQRPQTTVEGVGQRASAGSLTPGEQPTTTVRGEGQPPSPESLMPTSATSVVIDAIAGSIPGLGDLLPGSGKIQTTIGAVAQQVRAAEFVPSRTPTVAVQGEGRAPSTDSLTPISAPSVVINGITGLLPAAGDFLPSQRPQTIVNAIAQRAQVSPFEPSRQPTTTVQGEAQAPPGSALVPDAPSAVINAVVGSVPDPNTLVPGGVGQQLQTTLDGVMRQSGLSDEVSVGQSALAPAESAASRIAGTLHGGARSAAAAISGARLPGLNASVQVGDAPSQIPVDASGVNAALPTPRTRPDREGTRTVGEAATTQVQARRPMAPPTTRSPDAPVSAPGLGGAGGQPATVGAAAAVDSGPQTATQTVGGMARSQRQQAVAGEHAPPTITGDVPSSRRFEQPGSRPMPPVQIGGHEMGDPAPIDASTIIQNLNVGDPNSTPRQEMRGHVQREVGRAFRGRVEEVVDVVMARLYDAADTREQTQGPGTAQG